MVVRDDDIKILEKFLDFCNTHEEFNVFFEPFAGISCGEFTKVKNDYHQCVSKIEDITFNFVYNSLYNKENFMYECKNCKYKINSTMKRFMYRNFIQSDQTLNPCGRPFCVNKKDLIDTMINDSFYHDMYHDLSYIHSDVESYCYMKIEIFKYYVCYDNKGDSYVKKNIQYNNDTRNNIYSVDKNVYTFIQNYIKYRNKIHNCMEELGINLRDNREYVISEHIKREEETFTKLSFFSQWQLNNGIGNDSDYDSDYHNDSNSDSDSDLEINDDDDSYRHHGITYRQLGKIIDVTIYKEIYGIINILNNDSRIDELYEIYSSGYINDSEINIENLEKVILYYLKHKKAHSVIVKKLVENIDFKCSDINKLVVDFLW